jgi:hypothetical protein
MEVPHLVLVTPRKLELLPRIENQEILAVEMRAQLPHTRNIHDRRTMDALEPSRIELAFELAHRRAQHVRVLARVHAHVVAGGVDPEDVVHRHAQDAARVLDREPVVGRTSAGAVGVGERFVEREVRPARHRAEQPQQPPAVLVGVARRELVAHAIERDIEPRILDGLQEVVERVRFERLQCVLVVRRDEHGQRHLRRGQGLQELEAVDTRHLHVEEHDVGLMLGDREERLASVAGLADDLDVGMAREPERQTAPGEGFVVNDQRTQAHRLCPRQRAAPAAGVALPEFRAVRTCGW